MNVRKNTAGHERLYRDGSPYAALAGQSAHAGKLWLGEVLLDRAEVVELIGHLQAWVDTGSLAGNAEK
jgi:hypothetical protein